MPGSKATDHLLQLVSFATPHHPTRHSAARPLNNLDAIYRRSLLPLPGACTCVQQRLGRVGVSLGQNPVQNAAPPPDRCSTSRSLLRLQIASSLPAFCVVVDKLAADNGPVHTDTHLNRNRTHLYPRGCRKRALLAAIPIQHLCTRHTKAHMHTPVHTSAARSVLTDTKQDVRTTVACCYAGVGWGSHGGRGQHAPTSPSRFTTLAVLHLQNLTCLP